MSRKSKPSPSAVDLKQISPYLPSREAEEKKRAEYTELFSTAARAGAGGTRTGVPGLRPLGKRGMDFVDLMTPKREKKKNSYDEILPEEPKNAARRDVDGCVKIMLPRTFCPDCGHTDRPRVGGAINMNQWPEGRPEWGLGPKDIMLSFFCDECYSNQLRAGKEQSSVYLAQVSGIAQKSEYDAANRLIRIKNNTEGYMRAHCHDEEIRVKH